MDPLIKYPGGKRALLPCYRKYLPANLGQRRFIEPMCGGMAASLAWLGEFESVHVCDANKDLVAFYDAVLHADAILDIRTEAARYNAADKDNKEKIYYEWREQVGRLPAAFWLTNRTTFNGLVRYNARGKFNAPWGKVPQITDDIIAHVASVAERLRHSTLVLCGAQRVVEFCAQFPWREGDVAFFDPPYIGGFSAYTAGGFDIGDHAQLAWAIRDLCARGVHCMAANANHPEARRLYEGILEPVEVSAPRLISQDASTRGNITELLFVPRS